MMIITRWPQRRSTEHGAVGVGGDHAQRHDELPRCTCEQDVGGNRAEGVWKFWGHRMQKQQRVWP